MPCKRKGLIVMNARLQSYNLSVIQKHNITALVDKGDKVWNFYLLPDGGLSIIYKFETYQEVIIIDGHGKCLTDQTRDC